IGGKPLAVRVYQAVRKSPLLQEVIIATDSEEILEICKKQGCNVRMTSAKHRSGTERVHEVAQTVPADVYINVHGDEPMIRAEHIEKLVRLMERPGVQVGTLKTPAAESGVNNPNAVKVVADVDGRALYFSRSTIPHDRDGSRAQYSKHLGIY